MESGVEQKEDQDEELEEEDEIESKSSGVARWAGQDREVPNLTVKEKKELGSYANSLGDKLKSQQVGKSGVTENVVFAFNETLEKNELLKVPFCFPRFSLIPNLGSFLSKMFILRIC